MHKFRQIMDPKLLYNYQVQMAVIKYRRDYYIYQQLLRRRKLAIIAALSNIIKRTNKYKRKRFWMSELCQNRPNFGAFYQVYPIILNDPTMFRNYCRMTKEQFEDLLILIAPLITKEDAIRTPISAKERLLLTLRYLASGDSQVSISYEFGSGTTTVSQIISQTCKALWTKLAPLVLTVPKSQNWKESENNFRHKWNFPNCVGAIDGKHVVIQAPPYSGSTYYNYKGSHSLVLLAICDANYKFIVVDIGAEGRQSDGGVFHKSFIGQALINGEADFPPAKQIYENGPVLPHVLIADEAFPLTTYLMRPYPGRYGLTVDQRIFNYRLSRARRMIESTFGILVSQWRIFKKPIIANVENAHKIIEACVCLHNFIRDADNVDDNNCESDLNDNFDIGNSLSGLRNVRRFGSNTHSREAARVRDQFMKYFNEEGAVDWQFSKA